MTNNNRVGSSVDLFCKLYYNFDQTDLARAGSTPLFFSLVKSLFSSLFSSPPLSFTKQSYLSLTYMANVVP